MKHLAYFILTISLFLASCSTHYRVVNKGTKEERLALANKMYEAKEYKKALGLYELVRTNYQYKPEFEEILWRIAETTYFEELYFNASGHYDNFIKSFPRSIRLEEAYFKKGKAYAQISPKHSLHQKDTDIAIEYLQEFINLYPDSDSISKANKLVADLTYKKETKAFEIAKQYYKIGYYKAAIVAFNNVSQDYLGTRYTEDCLAYQFLASYELGINSIPSKKKERLQKAKSLHNRFVKNYPKSKWNKNLYKKYQDILKALETTV